MAQELRVYQLMNKDTVVLEQETVFEYGVNGNKRVIGTRVSYTNSGSVLPFGFMNLEQWVTHRITATQRMDVRRLLNLLGVKDTYDFIEVFHAVSLTDTFWVKNKDVEQHLKWAVVSPYRNPLDERIRKYAFNNVWDNKVSASRVSPEYSTDGSFAKCWQRENNVVYLCKYGTSGALNSGYEPYSEFYVNQLEARLDIENYVTYTLHKHNDRLYSKCQLFTSEKLGLVSVDALLTERNVSANSYQEVLEFLISLGLTSIEEEYKDMLVLDALTFNVDRHLGNIGVLFDTETLKLIRLAPIYDNNLALLPYWYEESESLNDFLKRHIDNNGQLDIFARTGVDFVTLGKQFMTSKMHKALTSIVNNGFKFEQIGSYNLSSKKLKALSKLVEEQARKILY